MSLPPRLAPYGILFAVAGAKYGIDPFLLAAICDRESNGGLALTPPGPSGTGDGGHGRGLMQVDDRAHATWVHTHQWQDPATNIDMGARILAGCIAEFPRALSSAVAAYNCGAGNVRRALLEGLSVDHLTTGRNYSADVLRRRAEFTKESAP